MKLFWTKILILSALAILFLIPTLYSAENQTIHLVGNAHIDLAYRWRWNETVDRVGQDTFGGVLKMMNIEPGLTFSQSQLALYEEIQKNNPDIFAGIKDRIKDGSWSVVGGQWAEPDAILAGGESYIRQFLIGAEYAEKHLGIGPTDIAWVPDSFCGQALTLPKIYSGCGIKYYVFSRGAPDGKRIFWWESPDGSKILAYKVPKHYNVAITENLKQVVQDWSAISKYKNVMILYGEGDHGGGPRKPDVKAIHHFQKQANFPKIQYSTPEKYFKELEEEDINWPHFKGEMGIGIGEGGNIDGSWRGSYTSQARVKKANRDMENLLITAEKFATIGSMLQRKPLFPRVDFREVWKLVLKNQFHDILPGTSIGDVFDDAMAEYRYVNEEGERLLRFGLEVIGSRIDTRGDGIPLVIYNPLSWERSGVIETAVRFVLEPEEFTIRDEKGNDVLFQIDGWSEDGLTAYVSLFAKNIPAIGYTVYRVFEEGPVSVDSDIMFGPDFVVNNFFKIKWDQKGITSVFDKKNEHEILSRRGNTLQLLGESRSSSWDLNYTGKEFNLKSLGKPRLIEEGPVRTILLWQDHNNSSFISRELVLLSNSPRLLFRMTVDWHDHDKILKVVFPTTIDSGKAVFEQPYGYIQRPTDGNEWPAQNWVDISDDKIGIALLNNGKYGFDVNKNVVRMSVVRGARDMDPRMDEGIHSFDYALYSHKGDFRKGNVTQQALELNQPLIATQENLHIGDLPAWGRLQLTENSLPDKKSFFSINSDHVIISAIKVQQGNWSPANVVLRIYETTGQDGHVTVNLPARPREIVEANHIEKVLEKQPELTTDNNSFSFQIGHNQVRTFLVSF
jgi:alpha-mannosidase